MKLYKMRPLWQIQTILNGIENKAIANNKFDETNHIIFSNYIESLANQIVEDSGVKEHGDGFSAKGGPYIIPNSTILETCTQENYPELFL